MSKNKLIIIIVIFILLVGGGFWYFNIKKTTGVEDKGNTFTNFFSSFNNPFAKITDKDTNDGGVIDIGEGDDDEKNYNNGKARFFKVSNSPISGYTVFQKERYLDLAKENEIGDSLEDEIKNLDTIDLSINTDSEISTPITEYAPSLRYVNKITGNIYQTFADNINEKKYTSTVVKSVHESIFGDSGNSVLMRYLKPDAKTIASYVGIMPKEVLGADAITANDLIGNFLPEGILEAIYSSDSTKMFYILPYKDGIVGITASADGSRKNQIFESAFTEWTVDWPNKDNITLTTKPASVADGFMYSLNPNTKSFNKILGKIKGLTVKMSPDGNHVLFADKDMTLSIYNIAKKQKTQLSVKTLPEKCVWGSDNESIYCGVPKYLEKNEYPDVWYQGLVNFSDDVWKIDIISNNATLILNPSEYTKNPSLDMINLKLDQNMRYLFLVDKNTNYLYEYKII